MSTNNERVQAVTRMGFTERQAGFLVLVMRHAGVCVPRQYARFAGIANGGKKCNAFFAKLVRRRFAAAIPCVHNRARLYHVHARGLYCAIGEGTSRYRRPVPAGRIAERLILLDAMLSTADVDWLTTAAEKRACMAGLTPSASSEPASDAVADSPSESVRDLPGVFPIGIEASGRIVLLYLATDPWTERFRTFLQGHAALLQVAPMWTIRLVFPRPLDHFYNAYQTVIREELESPLHPATIGELKWYFDHRRQVDEGQAIHAQTQRFLNVGAKVFGAPRFTEMYRRWRRHGDMVFEGASSPAIAEVLEAGSGTVDCLVLPHVYRHLSPLVTETPCRPEPMARGLRRGDEGQKREAHVLNPRHQPRPLETPLTVSEQLDRDWHRLNEWYKAQKALGVTP